MFRNAYTYYKQSQKFPSSRKDTSHTVGLDNSPHSFFSSVTHHAGFVQAQAMEVPTVCALFLSPWAHLQFLISSTTTKYQNITVLD